jgi:hypothetical protein
MQPQRLAPEGLVAERSEAKGVTALPQDAFIGTLHFMMRLQRRDVFVIG